VDQDTSVLEFQSTPLQEGRQVIQLRFLNSLKFQSTPLQEGRQYRRSGSQRASLFQSTPLQEGRPLLDRVTGLPL